MIKQEFQPYGSLCQLEESPCKYDMEIVLQCYKPGFCVVVVVFGRIHDPPAGVS